MSEVQLQCVHFPHLAASSLCNGLPPAALTHLLLAHALSSSRLLWISLHIQAQRSCPLRLGTRLTTPHLPPVRTATLTTPTISYPLTYHPGFLQVGLGLKVPSIHGEEIPATAGFPPEPEVQWSNTLGVWISPLLFFSFTFSFLFPPTSDLQGCLTLAPASHLHRL